MWNNSSSSLAAGLTGVILGPNLSMGGVGTLVGQPEVVHKLVEGLVEGNLLLIALLIPGPGWVGGTRTVLRLGIKVGDNL